MKLSELEKRIWRTLILSSIIVVIILNLNVLLGWGGKVLGAFNVVIVGAALAYILNLVMIRIEKLILKYYKKEKKNWIRPISILISFLIVILFLVVLFSLILPILSQAMQVLISVIPSSYEQIQSMLEEFFSDNPQINSLLQQFNLDWKQIMENTFSFLTSSLGTIFQSPLGTMNSLVNSLFNGLLAFILAIYMLADKERFKRLYHRFMNLFVPIRKKVKIQSALEIINQTFSSFIVGQFVEAIILGTLCIIGNLILNMPYAVMIGTLVGIINIIPMVGAYIGGAIGAFLVFTVNPVQAIVFIVYLCVLQQIESNLIYPRVVGKSVGLPGIYVLITVIVSGSLYGILGMLLGIPIVASLYKLIRIYIEQKEQELQHETIQNI